MSFEIPYHRPMKLSYTEQMKLYDKISGCFMSGQLSNGKYVEQLETKIKEMYKCDYCIATSSASQGLLLAIEYLKPHNILSPAFTWHTIKLISEKLKVPITYYDINKEYWVVGEFPTNTNACIVPNLTFGNSFEYFSDNIVFDGAHSLGALLPSIGFATVLSLAPTKVITSCEGGLILTNNKEFNDWVKFQRRVMCRMSELHALVGLAYLEHLSEVVEFKKTCCSYYKAHIPGQFQLAIFDHNYNTQGFLNTENLKIPPEIEWRQYYSPLKSGLVNTDYVYSKIVCLPSYFGVNFKEITKRILEVNK